MALSDLLAPALQIGSTILSAGGDIARGTAYQSIATRKRALAEFQAKQLDVAAGESQGAAMRNAAEEMRRAKLINSMALARAAASGASAFDPTVLKIMADTEAESAYRQALAMYQGESQARLQRMQAGALRYGGNIAVSDAGAAKRAANINAITTLLSGGLKTQKSMYERFWTGVKRDDLKDDFDGTTS